MTAMGRRTKAFLGLWVALVFLSLAAPSAYAHIGSPNVFYDGNAGPYHVIVEIRPPDVVPGVAQVDVRVDRDDITGVGIQPLYFKTGAKSAPAPDKAARVPGDARLFSGKLWLMEFGSSSVNVVVDGPKGQGSAIVPVPAMATARRGMTRGLGIALACFGLFIFAGGVALIGACVRDSAVKPGEPVTPKLKTRGRIVMSGAVILIVSAVALGAKWWRHEDSRYLRKLYKPIDISTTVQTTDGWRRLTLAMKDPGWMNRSVSDLIPDHGKLMHLYLISEPGFDALAHIHPVPVEGEGSSKYSVPVPQALGPGEYRVFADIVHADGLAETLTATVSLGAAPSADGGAISGGPGDSVEDPDDSWRVGAIAADSPNDRQSVLDDGSIMKWEQQPGDLTSGQLYSLKFAVATPDGAPARLEPYMGMLCHAALMKEDGTVFVHLHPIGTVPMASEEAFQKLASANSGSRKGGHGTSPSGSTEAATKSMAMMMSALKGSVGVQNSDSMPPMDMPDMRGMESSAGSTSRVSIPYSFPKPGRYYLWVQVKQLGRVLTGVFRCEVK